MLNNIYKLDITIFDLLDIVIVAVLIYILLIWLKQTRSRSITIGMFIAGAVYLFARNFNLRITLFIFEGFFSIFLIALVIIFQADIRRFFEVIGVWGIKNRFKRNTSTIIHIAVVDTIIKAVENLSLKKMGALLVIRGNETIERHLNGGVALNGQLSVNLLESLFDDNSPGHDGASIIENDILTKFGVHLPLSNDLIQIKQHGTRHAAALGLAERSDVFIIVVSEESGDISLAFDGKLEKAEDPGKLRAAMENFYREKYPQKRWQSWENLLKKHYLEKIISIPIAFIIWYLSAR